MKQLWVLAVALLVLVSLGASEQVTRDEFDALAKEVRALEGNVVMLDIRLKEAEKGPVAPAAEVPAQNAPQAVRPLEGRDLVAWKLARDAAEDYQKRSTVAPRVRTVDGRTPGRDNSSITAGFIPDPLDLTNATTAAMRKTETGDYVFTFKRIRTPGVMGMGRDLVVVRVTDYEDFLRVEKVEETDRP